MDATDVSITAVGNKITISDGVRSVEYPIPPDSSLLHYSYMIDGLVQKFLDEAPSV